MYDAFSVCTHPTRKFPEGRTGTPAGYDAHRAADEPPCRPCSQAHTGRCAPAQQRYRVTEHGKTKAGDGSRRWIRASLKIIRAAKAQPCTDCRQQYPYYVMHFDHLGDKDFNIGMLGRSVSRSRLIAEIAKCDVVCANCHAERTHQRALTERQPDLDQ